MLESSQFRTLRTSNLRLLSTIYTHLRPIATRLAWEILECLGRNQEYAELVKGGGIGNLFIHVGGGALGSGMVAGLRRAVSGELSATVGRDETCAIDLPRMPTIHTVQPVGNGPLGRAFNRIQAASGMVPAAGSVSDPEARADMLTSAASAKADFMFPWADPHSVASGILDDETYDWLALCDGLLETGGSAHHVEDPLICDAKAFALGTMGVNACHTGSAGFAGLLQHRGVGTSDEVKESGLLPDLVILSGLDRDA
jgi:hypothetical protein